MEIRNDIPRVKKDIEKDFLKLSELREYLGCGNETIYKMCENGWPRYQPYGKTILYYKQDVIDYILKHEL